MHVENSFKGLTFLSLLFRELKNNNIHYIPTTFNQHISIQGSLDIEIKRHIHGLRLALRRCKKSAVSTKKQKTWNISSHSCPLLHPISRRRFLSAQEAATPGGNPSRDWKARVKSGLFRHINVRAGLSAAGKTDRPYLWLHMWEREIEDTRVSAPLTCAPGTLVLTLKMCHESRKKCRQITVRNFPASCFFFLRFIFYLFIYFFLKL